MNNFITKEMLEKATVQLDERYTIGYSYTETGILIQVAKIEDDVLTFVKDDFIPWPTLDEMEILHRT